MSTLRNLHCFGDLEDFAAEQLPQRLEKLGGNLQHDLVGVASEHWTSKLKPVFKSDFPALGGKPTPGRLLRLANAIKPYDLVLTYGWGAIDVAMAHTLFSEALGLPPLVHHETALAGEEKRLSKRRTWYRRIALGKAAGLVVPNERLEEVALVNWQQPLGRVKKFAPGVAISSAGQTPKPDALPGIIKRDEEIWIGARIHNAQDAQALQVLVKALSKTPDNWHLVVIAGDIDTDMLSAEAENADIAHRLHMARPVDDLDAVVRLFDVWAGLTDTQASQRDALLAIAAARAVVAVKGSDIALLVSPDNAASLAHSLSPEALEDALRHVLDEKTGTRAEVSEANRDHASKNFDLAQSIDRYRRLYASAMKAEIKP